MAVTLELKVTPEAGRQRLMRNKSGGISCSLKSPPERGKANRELIEYIADLLDISKQRVTLISGETARHKVLRIDTVLSQQEIFDQLGVGDRQHALF